MEPAPQRRAVHDLSALSDAQYIAAWKQFAAKLPKGESARLDGVTVISGGVPLNDFNLVVPDAHAASRADFVLRIQRGTEWIRARRLPWTLVLNLSALSADLRSELDRPIYYLRSGRLPDEANRPSSGRLRFTRLRRETGMVADRPVVPLSNNHGLTFEPVRDSRTRRIIVEINFRAYGETPAPDLYGLDDAAVWDESAYGVIGYAGPDPVTSSAVFVLDNCFYVGWVATIPKHKRKGFASAVMRESLAAAARDHGWKRSVLHASAAGRGIYERMGYRVVAEHALYVPSD